MKALILTMACVLGMAASATAQNADVTGRWELTIATPQAAPAPMVLKKDGDKIVGAITGPQGEVPVEATVKDKAVSIAFTVQTQNGPLTVTLAGTADGDGMKGTADFGGRPGAEWFAKRTAAASSEKPSSASATSARIDVTGTWAVEVVMDAGAGSPTFVFKQDGEKLTGRYSGQLGEAPVTGTIKDGAIEFAIDADLQGTALHIVYSGVADNGAMKGTVKFGDLGGGTFTGKKK